LGTIWNKSSDELEFKFTDLVEEAKALPATKRSLLKVIDKIFDPLGFLSPFIIRWKVLFQILCIENVNWDSELIGEHLTDKGVTWAFITEKAPWHGGF
jgi:hypothetical protein